MKIAWVVLAISALTDFIITSSTALTAAMVSSGSAQLPGKAVIVLALLGGIVAMARTVQQALRAASNGTKANILSQ